jgi:peptidoglycan/LPS O-acetylase OafA/YrhL
MTGLENGARLHALDAVRGGALLLGVLFHATIAYLPGPSLWIIDDASASAELSVTFYVLHTFRMTAFFLLAGFFARLLLQKRGVGGFVVNRLKRIIAPLAMFWPVVLTAFIVVVIWVAVRANGGEMPAGEPPPPMTAENAPLTHLWFLYVLCFFYVGALLVRGLVVAIDRSGALRARVLDPVVKFIAGPAAPMFLAAATGAALYFTPNWMMWFGIPTPDYGLMPNPTALACYGLAFGFGWLVNRQLNILQDWAKHWLSNLGLGVFCSVASLVMLGVNPVLTPAETNLDKAIYAGLYALSVWGWTLGIIGAAMRLLQRENAAIRYVSDASYWIYIVHLPIVMALHVALAPLALPWFAKFPMVVGLTLAISFVSYELLVRYSWIGAILNGKRTRPARQRTPKLAAAE